MDADEIVKILRPEGSLENTIVTNPEFIEGCDYGKPRRGHPEGKVVYHITDVLNNIEKYSTPSNRSNLRLIALVHDSFKYKVDRSKPKTGENHHGYLARKFLERFISDEMVLEVVELHDEAYLSWFLGGRKGKWEKAVERGVRLAERLSKSNSMDLYLAFYRCDNETGDKERENFIWFNQILKEKGYL